MARISRGGWRRNGLFLALLATGLVVLFTRVDFTSALPFRPHLPVLSTFPSAPLAHACDDVSPPTTESATAPIPNIVHYIWLLADPAVLSLSFKVFITVYSSHLYLRPTVIYFHTDASPELWDHARSHGDTWTRRVLALPGVTPNFIPNPRLTTSNVAIDTFGAKSDFIRADALRTHGGIYLDTDAIPLRDLTPLRHAGFANVVGGAVALKRKYTGFVNTGVWLSRPHSNLAEIFYKGMDAFYNGVWAISVDILTDLAFRLHAIPGEVLIMHPRAFAPVSWETADQASLFELHPSVSDVSAGSGISSIVGEDGGGTVRNTCRDALSWLAEREGTVRTKGMEGWEMDFSSTYVLHAFDDDAGKIWGWDGQVTVKYVFARRSNYARAVYPAVWQAVREGIIPEGETV
ncbi:hypothetical protein C8A05DRAFT_44322 [Staphylotrichum tortipilum]|uniref:Glycosyltransferase family 32 protein n=1 Tax=Staphylotrichum tortipilum TaxID=2831512 RepID=A0AAN6MJR8_9PEZI|nr:hypothetical protein C8A05DRAFT_44322 [Staphylotrichum longicolle]